MKYAFFCIYYPVLAIYVYNLFILFQEMKAREQLKEEKNMNKLSHRHRVQRTPSVHDIRKREEAFTNDAIITGIVGCILCGLYYDKNARVVGADGNICNLSNLLFVCFLFVLVIRVARTASMGICLALVTVSPNNRSPNPLDNAWIMSRYNIYYY